MIEEDESVLALRAMERASRIARDEAAKKNLKIPVWSEGKVIFRNPKELSQQDGDTNE